MKFLIAIVLLAVASTAWSQNWVGLLKNSPAEHFDEEDLRIFLDTSRKALGEGGDNETFTWNNPKTRAGGEITVVRHFEWQTHRCKTLRLHNQAGGMTGTSTFDLCSIDGKWRLVTPPASK